MSWAQLHSLPSSTLFCDPGIWPQWTASHRFPTGFSQWEALAGIEVGAERGYCHSSHSSSGCISNKGCFSLWPQHPSGDPSSTSSFYLVTTLFLLLLAEGQQQWGLYKKTWMQYECTSSFNSQRTGNVSHREQFRWHKKAAKSEL